MPVEAPVTIANGLVADISFSPCGLVELPNLHVYVAFPLLRSEARNRILLRSEARNRISSRHLCSDIPKETTMKALTWHGKNDIRCDTVPDPRIQDGRDAIIKVTA